MNTSVSCISIQKNDFVTAFIQQVGWTGRSGQIKVLYCFTTTIKTLEDWEFPE